MSQARQKGAGKTKHFLQLVHCWEVCEIQGPCPCPKRSPSVIEPLDDMWWCNKKQKFKNEVDVYSMYVTIYRFFYIKCSHLTGNLPSGTVDGQNIQTPREGLEDTPSPNVKVKECVRDMSCCGVWFVLSTRLNPWKKTTTLKFGGRGG